MSRVYKIITRKSKLALVQVNQVVKELQKVDPDFQYEIVEVLSDGCYDRFKGSLKELGGKGAFVRNLETALLEKEADFAVHSMKDVPTDEELPEGLCIPAMLEREDIRDVIVCRSGENFVGLKEGAVVGTSSVRRAAQIHASFPHLKVDGLRGNVDTRLKKLDSGEVDAAVLAKAGLDRLGLSDRISEVFEPDMMLPAVGQGAVGVECRADDQELMELLAQVNHKDTFTCVTAERTMCGGLGGNCSTPIAGYCQVTKGGNLRLIAHVTSLDGTQLVRSRHKMAYDEAVALGEKVANDLLNQGAKEVMCPSAVSA